MRLTFAIFFACSMQAILASAETEWFTISLPPGWATANDKDAVIVTDASGSKRFVVSVNQKSNDYIMCFCAPLDKYEKFSAGGFTAARLEQFGTMTVKISGKRYSTDVHYAHLKNNEDAVNIAAIESIRPK